jgi:endonuclease/exonuclease/phosphatase family metal-dependent hydrolase
MKKSHLFILAFGIVILFFIQAAGTLVESIYILDLMNSSLDEKVLGILFFFTPVLLIPLYKKFPRGLVWISFAVLLPARGMLPYLNTANRVLASGLGVFAALSLFFLLLVANPKGEAHSQISLWGPAGLALAVSLSALLRTLDYGLDISLTPTGGWVGWGLCLMLGWLLTQLDTGDQAGRTEKNNGSVTPALLGIFLVLTLVWFTFSAPSVIARWTEGNYTLIVITISLFAVGWVLLSLIRPQSLERISPRGLLLWNLLFTLCLTATILAHRVPFPPTPDSAPVVVGTPTSLQQLPLVLMLLLFPVIFLDMRLFLNQIRQAAPAPRNLVPGILLGSTVLILLIFAHIFTNVWGYVKPVSLPFRNMFWLPYFLMTGIISLLVWLAKNPETTSEKDTIGSFHWGWALLLGTIFLGTLVRALPTKRIQVKDAIDRTSLVAMTFNTQQSNDEFAEKSYDRQLALIRKASPDILALQESDSTRISLNNNDYVRYFAEKLGYYSYYGPTTVTGTYGTAILSKVPLLNTRTVFTYSDKDEIGIAEAEIEVNGHRFTIYDVHPDGSDTAMRVFAKTLLERSKDKPYVIALGDYNLRDYQEAHQLIDSVYSNAWVSVYPTKISADGVDMSGENRIDHIFVSPSLGVRNPIYVLPPASATDHPVHWAEIFLENP